MGYVHSCGRNVIHHTVHVTETWLIDDMIERENKSLKRRANTEVAKNKQVSFAMISSIVRLGYFVLFMIIVFTFRRTSTVLKY